MEWRKGEQSLAVVHHVALGQQQQLVQLLVEPRAGLVDGGDHRAAAAGQPPQSADEVHRRRAVQPRGRLVCRPTGLGFRV